MSNSKKEDITLEQTIEQINGVLNEIKNEQINQRKMLEKHHKVNMQKFTRLLEFNEISDMTNQVFERRIANIEKILYDVFKK